MNEPSMIDMSSKAVFERLEEVGELYELGMMLMLLKPVGYVDPQAANAYLSSSAEETEIVGFPLRDDTKIGI